VDVKNHEFTFIASLADHDIAEIADVLFEAGCDDATPAIMKGILAINFDREAESYLRAVVSAIVDLSKTGLKINRFEPDFLVSASEIAGRAGTSRQSISNYANQLRGEGFPAPVVRITSDSPLWDWVDVSRWLHKKDMVPLETVLDARVGRSMNKFLRREHKTNGEKAFVTVLHKAMKSAA
jgi:hypothetical protein